jgi:hypothetical protein
MEGLSPACVKCQQVTGKSTCFPKPCVFFHERDLTGTKSNQIDTLDWIRKTGARRNQMASELPHESPLLPYEGLIEAMYSLSDQLAMTGWLDDDTNYAIYERVVKAWQSFDRSQTP